jgi:hypothetical protein
MALYHKIAIKTILNIFYFFHFHSIFDSLPEIKRKIFSRWRHKHNKDIHKNAIPMPKLMKKPKIGNKVKATKAPAEEYPNPKAINNHSIPHIINNKGLTANIIPNKQEMPLPP